MARLSRDARLETREARSRLKIRHEPYWRSIHPGVALGYRKGARGGVWLARKLEGKAYRKSTLGRADDVADADAETVLNYAQAHKAALAFAESPRVRAMRADPTVGEIVEQYLEHQQAHAKSAEATENKAEVHILPQLGQRRVSELTTDELRRWHANLARAPRGRRVARDAEPDPRPRKSSANRVLTVLKAALNFAYEQGLVRSDEVWRRVKPFKQVEAPRIRYLSRTEAKRLLNAADEDFRPLVRAALLTGCRYGELVRMRVADFNADAGAVLVAESKGGRPRHVYLTEEGQTFFRQAASGKLGDALLFTRSDGTAWGPSHQIRRMHEACDRAKIAPRVSFHDLRHTYGSLLAMKGVPLQIIAEALGHADTRITQRHYAHLHPDHVAKTIRASLPKFGLEETKVHVLETKS